MLRNVQSLPLSIALNTFLNSSITWASIAVVLTLYALFVDDVRLLYFPKESDSVIIFVNWIIFAIFVIEWWIDSIVRPEYLGSLTSFLDLLAALSLIPATEFLQDETSVARIARTFRALRILRATRAAAMALKTEASVKRVKSARSLRQITNAGDNDKAASSKTKSLLEATLLERSNVKMLCGVLVLLLGTSLIDYTETDRVGRAGLELVELHLNSSLELHHQFTAGMGAGMGAASTGASTSTTSAMNLTTRSQ